jgi:ATP-dependent Clp protease ATP-binding subunit ClpC
VNFKNTVIIMTSNIGSEHIDRMSNFGFSHDHGADAQYVQAKDKVTESLKNFFRPEFLNRLDETIIFDLLTPEVIADIVKIQVKEVIERLAKKDITLSVTDDVLNYLAKEGYDPKFGARPLRRVIQSKILTPLASMMVGEGVLQGGAVKVTMKKDKLNVLETESAPGSALEFEIKKVAKTKPFIEQVTKKQNKKEKETVAV